MESCKDGNMADRKLIEGDGYDGGDALFLHGDPKKIFGKFHGSLVMGYHDNLGIYGGIIDKMIEQRDVCIVQCRVHLVEDEEWRRSVQEDGKNQSNGGQGLFTAGKQADTLSPLAGNHDINVHPCFQQIRFVR